MCRGRGVTFPVCWGGWASLVEESCGGDGVHSVGGRLKGRNPPVVSAEPAAGDVS